MAARIVTIAQQKGGAGKTTVVAQLAVAWLNRGHSVAVVDIDPQGSLSAWHAVREEAMGAGETGLHLSDVAGWRLGTELDRLRNQFDYVLVDTPPHAETEAKAAVRAGDILLLPVQPSPMDLWATQPTIDMARKERTRALVVLNRLPPRGRLPDIIEGKLRADDLPVADARLGNRTAYAASMLEGKGVLESHRRTRAAEEVLELADEVDRLLSAG